MPAIPVTPTPDLPVIHTGDRNRRLFMNFSDANLGTGEAVLTCTVQVFEWPTGRSAAAATDVTLIVVPGALVSPAPLANPVANVATALFGPGQRAGYSYRVVFYATTNAVPPQVIDEDIPEILCPR